jgi:predicted ATPase
MLKSWSIENFKPIVNSGELRLAPVTVLAGRNSSGKSSLLQSILMIAQTLSSRILDRALLPSGPIVQLGTFEDILSEQTNSRTLLVSFELGIEKEELRAPANARVRLVDGRYVSRLGTNIKSVKVTSQFRSASGNGTKASAIEASKVNIDNVSLEVFAFPYRQLPSTPGREAETLLVFGIDIRLLSSLELEEFLKDISPEYLRLVPYTTKESNYLGEFNLQSISVNSRIPHPSLIAFSHFLPSRLIGKYFIEERRRNRLNRTISLVLEYPGDAIQLAKETPELLDLEVKVSDSFRKTVLELCKDESISEVFSGKTLLELIHWYGSLKLGRKKRTVSDKLKDIIAQSILEQSPQLDKETEALEAVTNNFYVENLEEAVEQIIQFFTSKIRYLGPLRADPQASQKFSPSSELDDVGAKGEYAAAVYDANQNASIEWYNPVTKQIERGILKVALDNWVRYLDVANQIKIETAGQSGFSWQVVHKKDQNPLPLSAVGVGVSQILPILVMGLLAPKDTLLMVEQPELHLHPGVQARLGDFFVGLSKCKKQCLIETHSENLVSQLRYHIVQAGGMENSDCIIYFVDQDNKGAARFEPVQISPQGNILNWPDGFFDETMLQEDRITAASIKKRANKVKHG